MDELDGMWARGKTGSSSFLHPSLLSRAKYLDFTFVDRGLKPAPLKALDSELSCFLSYLILYSTDLCTSLIPFAFTEHLPSIRHWG